MKGLKGQRADIMFQWQPWLTIDNCATDAREPDAASARTDTRGRRTRAKPTRTHRHARNRHARNRNHVALRRAATFNTTHRSSLSNRCFR